MVSYAELFIRRISVVKIQHPGIYIAAILAAEFTFHDTSFILDFFVPSTLPRSYSLRIFDSPLTSLLKNPFSVLSIPSKVICFSLFWRHGSL